MTVIVVIIILIIIVIGGVVNYRSYLRYTADLNFIIDYRNQFQEFSDSYFTNELHFMNTELFGEKYIWLTKHVNKVQMLLGGSGVINYIGPFQSYQVKNYQVLINTLPKYRDGTIKQFDAFSADDSLLRYIGILEDAIEKTKKRLKNPFKLFGDGIHEIISFPIYLLNWFGLLQDRSTKKIVSNSIYLFFTGFVSLITLISGVVTIIQGKEKTIEFFDRILSLL